jgi:hypothetical protein
VRHTGNRADTAALGWATAAEHIGRGQALNGAVVLDSADALAGLVGRANPQLLPCGVSGDGGHGGEEDERGLHVEVVLWFVRSEWSE